MSCNFNTFFAKSDQSLVDDYFKDYPNRYSGTTKGMFRFVCWLKNLDGVTTSNKWETAKKTTVKALAIIGMVVLCPLVIGGFLLNWYFNANRNVDDLLGELRKAENDNRESIIKALDVEKRGIIIPTVTNRPSIEEMKSKFTELNSPIFQCNGDFIAILLKDKKTQQQRVATIEKKNHEWVFNKLRSNRVSEYINSCGVPSSFDQMIRFGLNVVDLKKVLKGQSEYDELGLDFLKKPQEELKLGGSEYY